MWSFAWLNLVTRPTRTSLAVLGLTIPVLAVVPHMSGSNTVRRVLMPSKATQPPPATIN